MEKDIIGSGWTFPVKPTAGGRLAYSQGEDRIRQSIWIILSTATGEREMLPEFGCGINDLVFQPNTPTLWGLLKQKVRDSLVRWEPRIDVIDVNVEASAQARNYLLISIDYRVRTNNAFFNLVYPFFLNEGAGL